MANELERVNVPFASEKLKIALAQLTGPSDAKKVAYVDGRETYYWTSEEEVRRRTNKLEHLLAHVAREHNDTNLLVLPEYTLPLESLVATLQHFANTNGIVIVAGSDSIRSGHGKIYNQCPVFIPKRRTPVWIRKRTPSQWELTKVDSWHGKNPIFRWKHAGASYWFSVHICLDFLHVLDEPVHALNSPGFFIVPMCSQEMITMRNYADTLLRPAAGRACVLANAVDSFAIGSSCVMAVTPDGKPLQPAIEVPKDGEYRLTFELDCAQLAPPKKSPSRPISPLSHPWLLERIAVSLSGYEFQPETAPAQRPSIGIINPEVFKWHGLRMRIAFRSVKNYTEMAERNRGRDFEILAVLGQEDIVISHLATWEYDFEYDLRDMGVEDEQKLKEGAQHFSYFEVDTFFKALGAEVKKEVRGIFDGDKPKPTADDLNGVFALGENWNTSNVTDVKKREFVSNGWVLGETRNVPGDISAIMAITLVEGDQGIFDQFEQEVMPSIVGRSEVTSIYGGASKRRHMDYILRITTDLQGLYPLIEFVHRIAERHRIMITTTTYVVVHRIASLKLTQAFGRSGGRIHYAFHDFLGRLESHDKRTFRELSEERQRAIVLLFERAERALRQVFRRVKDPDASLARALVHIAQALLIGNPDIFAESFGRLHSPAERALDADLERVADRYNTLAAAANVPSGRTRDKLTYGEKIRTLREAVKARLTIAIGEDALLALSHTVDVRNSFFHQKADKLAIDVLVAAIEEYAEFYRSEADHVEH